MDSIVIASDSIPSWWESLAADVAEDIMGLQGGGNIANTRALTTMLNWR